MDNILQLISQLFRETGLLSADGTGQDARLHCINSQQCWQSEPKDRFPRGQNAIASFPWIGSNYAHSRMLLVGENLFDCGGVPALDGLVISAREELQEGRSLVTFGIPRYHSFFWYRAAAYASIWLNYLSGVAQPLDNHPESVANAFDFVAVTNQVKCSPASSHGVRSTPNVQMWEECGKTILQRETDLLGAKRIIVLGIGNNLRNLLRNLMIAATFEERRYSKNIITIKEPASSREVLAVRHPAAPGGNSKRLFLEVSSAIVSADFSKES